MIVKHAVGRFAARSVAPDGGVPPDPGGREPRRSGRRTRRSGSQTPIRLEVDFALTQMADMAELVPGSVRTAGRTLEFLHEDYREVFRAWRALYNLAGVE